MCRFTECKELYNRSPWNIPGRWAATTPLRVGGARTQTQTLIYIHLFMPIFRCNHAYLHIFHHLPEPTVSKSWITHARMESCRKQQSKWNLLWKKLVLQHTQSPSHLDSQNHVNEDASCVFPPEPPAQWAAVASSSSLKSRHQSMSYPVLFYWWDKFIKDVQELQ